METFAEIIARLSTAAENPLPESFVADLNAGYANDIGIRDAAIAERDTKIADAATALESSNLESMRLKAVNYDLMVKAPAKKSDDDVTPNPDETPTGVSSLFG